MQHVAAGSPPLPLPIRLLQLHMMLCPVLLMGAASQGSITSQQAEVDVRHASAVSHGHGALHIRTLWAFVLGLSH